MFSFIFIISFLIFWLLPFLFLDFLWIKILNFFVGFWLSVMFAWIIVLFLFFLCMCVIRKLRLNHPWKKQVIASISRLIMRFFRIQIIVYNMDLIPLTGKLVVYSNHKTNFDSFIIASLFPRHIAFTPKDELYRGYFGWFLSFCFNASNCIQVNRGNNRETVKNLTQAIENIKQNLAMVIFHEGGIKNKTTDKITNSLDGAFRIALNSHSMILPISLKGVLNMRGKCWFRRKKVEVFIHPHLNYEDYKQKNTQEINKNITNIINSVL